MTTVNEFTEIDDTNTKKKKKKKRKKKKISFQQELLRKTIHLISLSIPIIYIFVNWIIAVYIIIPITLITISIDILSKKHPKFREYFINTFGDLLRKHEKKKNKFILNGASWVLISASIMIIFFPKIITVTAFTILILSDIAAALIGRRWGTHKLFNKTWEGTFAFIIVAILIVIIYGLIFSAPIYYFLFGFLAAIISGFTEAASKKLKLDDNLTIPISAGIVLWVGEFITAFYNSSYINIL